MKKVAILYHKIDFDGICSYVVVRDALETNAAIAQSPVEIVPIPWNRGDVVPDLTEYDTVYVLDVCLPVEVMKELNDMTTLVWIDHHETSIREMSEAGLSHVRGLRGKGVSACELAWARMNPGEKLPKAVAMLSAYDVWDKKRFDWNGETLPFQYGLRNRYALDAEAFCNDFGRILTYTDAVIDEGRAVLKYVRASGRVAARNYGFDVTVAGKMKGLAILSDNGDSVPYEESAIERGAEVVVMLNRLGDDRYKVSCFCPQGHPSVHLGEYLKVFYGGGGHESAAGATVNEEEFFRFLKEKTL